MSRSIFLSAGGDVFLADFVLSLWNKHWRDEIDTFYVGYNNHAEVPQETAYEFLRKWEKDPKVRIIYTPTGVGNGTPILQMLLNSKEENLMLIEDDGFIFTPGIVDSWFKIIESHGDYDIVGSPRYTAGEIAQAAKEKYKLDYSGVGDKGFGWWPNFFLCRRSDLLKTSWRFASDEYSAGQYIPELDHTMQTTEYTDTFTFACLQLRHMGLKTYEIPQNHAHPMDLTNVITHEVMFANGDPKYIHGGSLSSGWGGYLNKKLPPVMTDMEKQDIETRIAMWYIVVHQGTEYESFRKEYKKAVGKLASETHLYWDRIEKKINLYKNLMHI